MGDAMRNFIQTFFGVPLLPSRVRAEVEKFVRLRGVKLVREIMAENLQHLTGKSGALLTAQGMFVVVAIYALDHGAARGVTLSAVLLLVVAALVVMTNLRSVYISPDDEVDAGAAELQIVIAAALTTSRRGATFNIALYLSFIAIAMMGVGYVGQGL